MHLVAAQPMLRGSLVVLCAVICVLGANLIGPRSYPGHIQQHYQSRDTNNYFRMVTEGPGSVNAPFAYRIGAPALVSILTQNAELGFFILSTLMSVISIVAFYFLLIALQISPQNALWAAVYYALSYPITMYIGAFGRVDPLANAILIVVLLCIARQRLTLALLTLTIGVTVRETGLLLVPIVWLNLILDRRRSSFLHLFMYFALSLLPFVVYALILFLVTPAGSELASGGIITLMTRTLAEKGNIITSFLHSMWLTYGFFTPIFLVSYIGCFPRNRWFTYSVYLFIVGFSLCLIASDWERMLATGAPGLFIALAYVLASRTAQRWKVLWLVLTIVQLLLVFSVFSALSQLAKIGFLGVSGIVALLSVISGGLVLREILRAPSATTSKA